MLGITHMLGAVAITALVAGGVGLKGGMNYVEGQQAKAAVDRSEADRESERLANKSNARINDDHTTQTRLAVAAAGARLERLRKLSDAERAANPSLGECGADAPATAVIRGADRDDLVALAEEADDVARALEAFQRREREVMGCTAANE